MKTPVSSDPLGILREIFRKRIYLSENQEWLHKEFKALKQWHKFDQPFNWSHSNFPDVQRWTAQILNVHTLILFHFYFLWLLTSLSRKRYYKTLKNCGKKSSQITQSSQIVTDSDIYIHIPKKMLLFSEWLEICQQVLSGSTIFWKTNSLTYKVLQLAFRF